MQLDSGRFICLGSPEKFQSSKNCRSGSANLRHCRIRADAVPFAHLDLVLDIWQQNRGISKAAESTSGGHQLHQMTNNILQPFMDSQITCHIHLFRSRPPHFSADIAVTA
jgi:hypothetical protein